ncbi:MAG: hypothetical protein KIT56_06400 [Gammaproteobacteria bacterium]|nr:hypothetical protein [Gammaproteobacteria bacterium]MCW5583495.1 hypothetical protein [Gammaproteobacteria bacterium]
MQSRLTFFSASERRKNKILLETLRDTIQEYFAIYVTPNLERLLTVESLDALIQHFRDSKYMEEAEYNQYLSKRYGENGSNDEIKSIFRVLYFLLHGKLIRNDLLMKSLLSIVSLMSSAVDISIHNLNDLIKNEMRFYLNHKLADLKKLQAGESQNSNLSDNDAETFECDIFEIHPPFCSSMRPFC